MWVFLWIIVYIYSIQIKTNNNNLVIPHNSLHCKITINYQLWYMMQLIEFHPK